MENKEADSSMCERVLHACRSSGLAFIRSRQRRRSVVWSIVVQNGKEWRNGAKNGSSFLFLRREMIYTENRQCITCEFSTIPSVRNFSSLPFISFLPLRLMKINGKRMKIMEKTWSFVRVTIFNIGCVFLRRFRSWFFDRTVYVPFRLCNQSFVVRGWS